MNVIKITLYVLALLAIISCKSKENNNEKFEEEGNLTVYAASGIRPAIEVISKLISKSDSCSIISNYASSGILARQSANGADCDVFISANKQWIDFLLEKGILDISSVQVIAENSLVVISPLDSKIVLPEFSFEYDIKSDSQRKIAIGNPDFTPVGKYAKMLFDTLEWYEKLAANLVMCKDVSSVRHYVELGECDWGIVYYTEAIQSKELKIVSEIPAELHEPIYFYAATLKNGSRANSAKYITFITSQKGQSILQSFGFTTDIE